MLTTITMCVSMHSCLCLCHVISPSISLFCCSKPPFSTDPFIHNSSPVATHKHTHRASPLFLSTLLPYPRLLLPTSKTASLYSWVDISAVTLNLSSIPDLDARLTGESRFSPGCSACTVLTLAAGLAVPVITHTHI